MQIEMTEHDMQQPPRGPLSLVEHREVGQTLLDLRTRLGVVIDRTLERRVPAAVLDAALAVDRKLATLSMRLGDRLPDAHAGLYPLDVPLPSPLTPAPAGPPRHLSPDEHRALGVELYRLRERVLGLVARLGGGRHAKSGGVGRVLHEPLRALDRLRCRLDGLFYAQHRDHFDTRVYYPGSTWAGAGDAADALTSGDCYAD